MSFWGWQVLQYFQVSISLQELGVIWGRFFPDACQDLLPNAELRLHVRQGSVSSALRNPWRGTEGMDQILNLSQPPQPWAGGERAVGVSEALVRKSFLQKTPDYNSGGWASLSGQQGPT